MRKQTSDYISDTVACYSAVNDEMEEERMIISERVFSILKDKGISQKDFAEATGIAQSTISDWKRKKTNPAADKIMVICDVLGVSPVELLSGTEGEKFKQLDYLVLSKDSPEYELVTTYRNLGPKTRARLTGYMQALRGE